MKYFETVVYILKRSAIEKQSTKIEMLLLFSSPGVKSRRSYTARANKFFRVKQILARCCLSFVAPCSIWALEQTIRASGETIGESLVLINNLINIPKAYQGDFAWYWAVQILFITHFKGYVYRLNEVNNKINSDLTLSAVGTLAEAWEYKPWFPSTSSMSVIPWD